MVGVGDIIAKKISPADISAFLQLIGKLSLSDWPRLARGSDWHRLALIGTDWIGLANLQNCMNWAIEKFGWG